MSAIQPNHDEAHAAFCRYAEAKGRAEASMDFRDAMIAGRAWVAFLNVFLEPQQQLPTSTVIPFPKQVQR